MSQKEIAHSLKYIWISIAAFSAYCNTLWGTFVFDDNEAIVKNKDVMPYTPIQNIFKNDFWGTDIGLNSSHKSYRPLTILSYRLNVMYSHMELDAFQFHSTNVILYGLLCLLTAPVYELFLRKSRYQKNISDTALHASLLFAVHPIHTESVAGLVGRADLLNSIFFFLALLVYDNSRISKGMSSVLWYLLGIFLIVCAVLCKETAISVVGMWLLYDIYREKKRSVSWRKMFTMHRMVKYATLIIPGFIIMFYRFKVMNFEGPIFTSNDNPAAFAKSLFSRVFTYNYIYLINILLLIWPQWLCFDWSMGCIPLIESICDIRVIYVILFWIIISCSLFKIVLKSIQSEALNAQVMGIALIVLPFLPACNLFFIVGFVIAERTLLLPSAGYCFLVVIGLNKIKRHLNNKNLYSLLFHLLILIYGMRSILRNVDWLTEERLFVSALEVCPLNAKVHYNIAKVAGDNNNRELALIEYRRAIQLNPNYEQAMNNLANLLRDDKKFEEAEALLRNAVSVRPNFAAAWMNLGIILTNLNKSDEAEDCYKKAITYRPKYPDCYYNLGNLYLDMGRNDEALKAWEMAVAYRPTHVAAWSNMLVLLDSMKKYDEVLDLSKTALTYNPKSPALHFSLANTLGKLQKFEKAESHFLEAINLNNNNALYYSNLGVLYHRWGKQEKAIQTYKKALKIDPNMKTAEMNLKRLSFAQ